MLMVFFTYLQYYSKKLCKWFSGNEMKGDTERCNLVLNSTDSIKILIRNSLISRSICKKLLGTKMILAEKLLIKLEH